MINFAGKFDSDAHKSEVSITVEDDDMASILNALEVAGFAVDEDNDDVQMTKAKGRTTQVWIGFTEIDAELLLRVVDNPS